jgi:hypothetical protein
MNWQLVSVRVLCSLGLFVFPLLGFYTLINRLQGHRHGVALQPDGDDVAIDFLGVTFKPNRRTVAAVGMLIACALLSVTVLTRPIPKKHRTPGSESAPNWSIEQTPERHGPEVPEATSEAVAG